MAIPSSHPSDSSAQRLAEKALLIELYRQLGFEVHGQRVDLGNGCHVMVDGINRKQRFVCEIVSRIGTLRTSQVEKVASDILKLTLVERTLGGQWRKAMCFADDRAANVLRNRSWLATAAKAAQVEVIVCKLPEDVQQLVLVAQGRQVMVNKAGSGG